MIQHIRDIVRQVVFNAKLAQVEKIILDKYESLTTPVKEEQAEKI